MTTDVVKFVIILRNGTELELLGSRHDSIEFHKRYKKWVDNQVHKTDNHRLLVFDDHYIHAETVAVYYATDFSGKRVSLGAPN